MKTKLFFVLHIFLFCNAFPQNITNTLGVSGLFSIKDNSITYLSLSQSTGYVTLNKSLTLQNTNNSTTGVIYKGSSRFMHNFSPSGATGHNTFLGENSGNFTMTAPASINSSYLTAIGFQTLYSNTTGYRNTAIGYNSMQDNSTGFDNISIGYFSLNSNTSGTNNTALGNFSLKSNTLGSGNTAVGFESMNSNIIGAENTAIGYQALYTNINGSNTAIGSYSMYWNSSGYYNTAVGSSSLQNNTNGIENTAIGYNSLFTNNTGYKNTALGYFTLFDNVSGFLNTAIGGESLFSNTSGSYNTAAGLNSLASNTIGNSNTAVGNNSLYGNISGDFNVALGNQSGTNLTTGNNNILIGYQSQPSSNSVSNQITLGNGLITSLRCNVTTITSLSDSRDKKQIKDLTLGLDFISKLKPRLFNWDKREWYDNNISDGSKMQQTPTAGFIAQELDEVQKTENAEWLNLVLKDNPEKLEATPGNLLPVIVKAIQELMAENDKLKNEVETLKKVNEKILQMELILSGLKNNGSTVNEIKSSEK
jgi:hypothetical protein